MPLSTARAHFDFQANEPAAAPARGGTTSGIQDDWIFGNGTGERQLQDSVSTALSFTASETKSIDLRAMTDNQGNTISLAKVVAIMIETPKTNTGTLVMGKGAANGFDAMFAASAVVIPPGSKVILINDQSASWPTDATHKVLDIVNSVAAVAAATFTAWGT